VVPATGSAVKKMIQARKKNILCYNKLFTRLQFFFFGLIFDR